MSSSDTVGGNAAFLSCVPVSLKDSDSWDELAREISGGAAFCFEKCEGAAGGLIRYLKGALKVRSYLLEECYIDRDYSADYLYFYSRIFKDYDRYCKRIHFFSEDINKLVDGKPLLVSDILKEPQHQVIIDSYCGFCVLRPLPHASIGRTVLKREIDVPKNAFYSGAVTCRANFPVNLFGIDLKVTGAAFLQQDSRVGACAQVAIWSGMRHMHSRHGCNWVSVADITKYAESVTKSEATSSLPAGSNGLSTDAMNWAIHSAGYQPLHFYRHESKSFSEDAMSRAVHDALSQLPSSRKREISKDASDSNANRETKDKVISSIGNDIFSYVESGIPVILGWNSNPNKKASRTASHAVTVIGRVLAERRDSAKLARSNSDRGYVYAHNYVAAYIIHDDQAGPYMLLPMNGTYRKELEELEKSGNLGSCVVARRGKAEINVSEHAHTAVALMSPRVFSTAPVVERAAWDRINDVVREIRENCEQRKKLPPAELQKLLKMDGNDFSISDQIVLRTYLSSVAGYRRHLANGSASDGLKRAMLTFHLPHFVWVTEISTTDSYSSDAISGCCVYGHVVTDATSMFKNNSSEPLVLHLPGLLFISDITVLFESTEELQAMGEELQKIAKNPQEKAQDANGVAMELQAMAETLQTIIGGLKKITKESQKNATDAKGSVTALQKVNEVLRKITEEHSVNTCEELRAIAGTLQKITKKLREIVSTVRKITVRNDGPYERREKTRS